MTFLLVSLALVAPAGPHAGPATMDAFSFAPVPSSPLIVTTEPAPVFAPFAPADDDHRANGGWYFGIGGGLTSTEDSQGLSDDLSFDEGWTANVALGHRFGPIDAGHLGWALEVEALYSDQDVDADGATTASSDVSLLGGHINALLEFPVSDFVGLYAGGGLGAASISVGDFSDDLSDFSEDDGPYFSWQAKAGVRLWSSSGVSLSLGYRFVNVDDAELDDGGGAEFDLETTQHMLELGIRFAL
jgi:opacity protein-like surface antigen